MNKWLKLILVTLGFVVISIALFFIFKACGITDLETLKTIISNSGNWGFIVFILIQILCLVCLCFIPIINPTLIILGIILFGAKTAFAACIIAVFFSSTILFFIGDKFGEKLIGKIVGNNELNKIQDLIDTKSKILLPLSFIIPGFPDEAFCIVAGITKMKYWYFITINVLCHIIEIGIICFFGSSLINWSSLELIDWIMIGNLIIIDIYLLFQLEKFINKKSKKQTKNDKN